MSTSAARIEANRQNAMKSTGPRTEAGKATSRRNALKHGLTATVVDLEPFPARPDPQLPADWLADQAARTMSQIDRARRVEGRLRLEASWRATATWDDDRRLDAENLAVALPREPSRTVARLRQTPAGCDWLIERWEALARAAEADTAGVWTPDETRLAFDLLGAPEPGRTEQVFHSDPTGRAGFARAMVLDLQEHRADVAELDEIARIGVEGDQADTPTPELARVRRYDQALHRRLQWLMAEFRTREAALQPESPPVPAVIPPAIERDRNKPNAPIPTSEANPTQTDPGGPSPLGPPVVPTPDPSQDRSNRLNRRPRERSA